MYKGKKKSSASHVRESLTILFVPVDEEQLRRTLSLEGVVGDKPCINECMVDIAKRLDDEDEFLNNTYLAHILGGDIDDLPFDDDDSDYYDGFMSVRERKKRNKKEHKRSRHKKSRARKSYDSLYDEDDSPVLIKFYDDINNELSCREFTSLHEFEEWCSEKSIIVNTLDYTRLLNSSEIHCCLDPIDLEYGDKVLITDHSYGGLWWSVSEDVEKQNALGV